MKTDFVLWLFCKVLINQQIEDNLPGPGIPGICFVSSLSGPVRLGTGK
jgi:hypothetical protein